MGYHGVPPWLWKPTFFFLCSIPGRMIPTVETTRQPFRIIPCQNKSCDADHRKLIEVRQLLQSSCVSVVHPTWLSSLICFQGISLYLLWLVNAIDSQSLLYPWLSSVLSYKTRPNVSVCASHHGRFHFLSDTHNTLQGKTSSCWSHRYPWVCPTNWGISGHRRLNGVGIEIPGAVDSISFGTWHAFLSQQMGLSLYRHACIHTSMHTCMHGGVCNIYIVILYIYIYIYMYMEVS